MSELGKLPPRPLGGEGRGVRGSLVASRFFHTFQGRGLMCTDSLPSHGKLRATELIVRQIVPSARLVSIGPSEVLTNVCTFAARSVSSYRAG